MKFITFKVLFLHFTSHFSSDVVVVAVATQVMPKARDGETQSCHQPGFPT